MYRGKLNTIDINIGSDLMTNKLPESLVEISTVSPGSHEWTLVMHKSDSLGGFEAGIVAERALALYIDIASPTDQDNNTRSAEARNILSAFERDKQQGESTILDNRQQSIVAVAVESLAYQSPSSLKENPALAHYAGFVAAARYYSGIEIGVGEPPSTFESRARDVPIFRIKRPEVTVNEPITSSEGFAIQADDLAAISDQPLPQELATPAKLQERDNTWQLQFGRLTVNLAFQWNKG